MPGSRALKEKTLCSPSNHKGPGKESVSKPAHSKQYNQTGKKGNDKPNEMQRVPFGNG